MTKVYEFPQLDKRYEEASHWCARMDEGLSTAEEAQVKSWIAESEENRQVLFEVTKLWDDMSAMSRLSDLIPEPAPHPRRHLGVALAAASVVLAVIVGGWVLLSPSNRITTEPTIANSLPSNVYETQIGEQSTVVLLDGTQVVLNTNSRLEVRFTTEYRLLLLDRGEIHVDVAHDKIRPLSVLAGDRIVQAVGTAFSVQIKDNDKIDLIVSKGEVRVGVREQSVLTAAKPIPRVLAPTSVAVAAGEVLSLGAPVENVIQVSPEEIDMRLSWRDGNLIFRGETLEEAVLEVGRYTTAEFIILDDEIKARRVGGRYRAGDIDEFLAGLKENLGIEYKRTDDGKVLLAKL